MQSSQLIIAYWTSAMHSQRDDLAVRVLRNWIRKVQEILKNFSQFFSKIFANSFFSKSWSAKPIAIALVCDLLIADAIKSKI